MCFRLFFVELIRARPQNPSSTFLRFVSQDVSVLQNFVAVNGGHGQSCRGKHAFDKEERKHIPEFGNDLRKRLRAILLVATMVVVVMPSSAPPPIAVIIAIAHLAD